MPWRDILARYCRGGSPARLGGHVDAAVARRAAEDGDAVEENFFTHPCQARVHTRLGPLARWPDERRRLGGRPPFTASCWRPQIAELRCRRPPAGDPRAAPATMPVDGRYSRRLDDARERGTLK